MREYNTILVAVDERPEAELGVKKGIAIAKQHGAQLVLVHVVDVRTYTLVDRGDVAFHSNVTANRRKLLNAYQTSCRYEGVFYCQAELAFGNPGPILVKEMVSRHQPDLIILGSARMGKIKKWLSGNVEHHVMKNASCDVLTVQAG